MKSELSNYLTNLQKFYIYKSSKMLYIKKCNTLKQQSNRAAECEGSKASLPLCFRTIAIITEYVFLLPLNLNYERKDIHHEQSISRPPGRAVPSSV